MSLEGLMLISLIGYSCIFFDTQCHKILAILIGFLFIFFKKLVVYISHIKSNSKTQSQICNISRRCTTTTFNTMWPATLKKLMTRDPNWVHCLAVLVYGVMLCCFHRTTEAILQLCHQHHWTMYPSSDEWSRPSPGSLSNAFESSLLSSLAPSVSMGMQPLSITAINADGRHPANWLLA